MGINVNVALVCGVRGLLQGELVVEIVKKFLCNGVKPVAGCRTS